ncbi:MAG: ABC transporter permease [Rhodospirillales bacterium]|jgi:sodium transport system permease protein|nr:ABC transporter permease [Rhodospirillales bacterium]MBT4040950.1 ABC transporter permease [Rhodospirillales bacterium]MBT4625648.1 ABC transporter permease [Rhodospirillales bacterium]MBT5350183.1 ABC transporter permease [Rhodospirillales bacterium]MBT5522035.1 ABC transporter permease [Rhodospirillales bacterium]
MWQRILIVLGKEIVDNARDRRSLLTALIYPLLGPLLLGLMISATGRVTVGGDPSGMNLAVAGAEHGQVLVGWLEGRGVNVVPPPTDIKGSVQRGDMPVVLVLPPGFDDDFAADRTADISIVVDSSRLSAVVVINQVASLLSQFNTESWGERMIARGVDFRSLQPVSIETVKVSSGSQISEIFLLMVPPLFIFNLFMGGAYLAMDTTSGERERGSLEPLLINPVERWVLVVGKFLATLFYTGIAVVVQLIALKIAFGFGGDHALSLGNALGFTVVLGILVVTLPLMAAAVGVQFVIATVTKSFKEAQTYLGLLPLVPAIPGMLLVFAPVQIQGWMMAVPTFSQTLLLGQLLRGETISVVHLAISAGTTLALAAVLVTIASRLYDREALIFGG